MPRPSMVVTFAPSSMTVNVRHADSPVINNDRTSTALTVIATFFDAGQVKFFSQRVQQGRAGLQR